MSTAGSWDDEADYRYFPTWRQAFDYAFGRAHTDSGGIDGGFLLAFAVIIAVVLVYVAAGGAR